MKNQDEQPSESFEKQFRMEITEKDLPLLKALRKWSWVSSVLYFTISGGYIIYCFINGMVLTIQEAYIKGHLFPLICKRGHADFNSQLKKNLCN